MLEFLGVMGMVEIGGNEREKEEETGGINLLLNGNFRSSLFFFKFGNLKFWKKLSNLKF